MGSGRGELTPIDKVFMIIFSKNLNTLIDNNNYSQIEIVNATKIPASTLNGYVNGKALPTKKNAEILANFFNIKPSELDIRLLEESPDVIDAKLNINSQILDLNQNLYTNNHKNWVDYGSYLLEKQNNNKKSNLYSYPITVITKLAAGNGFSSDDNDKELVYVKNNPPKYDIASFITGDSMEPNYHDGDIVYLLNNGNSTYNGQVCAIAFDSITYLKKVYTEKNKIRLVSLNPKYNDIFLEYPKDGHYIHIYPVVGTDSVSYNKKED